MRNINCISTRDALIKTMSSALLITTQYSELISQPQSLSCKLQIKSIMYKLHNTAESISPCLVPLRILNSLENTPFQ